MKTKLLLSLVLATVATTAFSETVEKQIKFRQSAYEFLGWNTGKIKSNVADHPETYNKEQVIAATNAIAAIANSGLSELYGVGTDQGTGWRASHLKPEYFEKQTEVNETDATFIKEANELQKVATTGDIAAIKTQFGKVGAACKSCHDLARVRE